MYRLDQRRTEDRFAHDWWGKLDAELLDCLTVGPMSVVELGGRLGLSEASTASLVAMLARDGKVKISTIELA